jgi:membrane-associated phospholipid phosphatase
MDSTRGLGVTDALSGGSEWPAVVVVALLTQLGDVWFLGLLGSVAYLGAGRLAGLDRRRGLFVLSLVVAYVVLVELLKATFAVPRPPGAATPPDVPAFAAALEPLLADAAAGDGYGFPSGHAMGTTLVWGGLALVLDGGRRRTRLAVAAGVVLVVSTTRLALGVHYAVDVVAGAVVGVAALWLCYRVADRGESPGRVLLVAAGIGALAVATHLGFETVAALGAAVGGALGWYGSGRPAADSPGTPAPRPVLAAGIAGFIVAGVIIGGLYVANPTELVTFVGTAVATAVAVAVPVLSERLD